MIWLWLSRAWYGLLWLLIPVPLENRTSQIDPKIPCVWCGSKCLKTFKATRTKIDSAERNVVKLHCTSCEGEWVVDPVSPIDRLA